MLNMMKLRGAIRSHKGNPEIRLELAPGRFFWIPIQKTPLLKAIGNAFDGVGTAQTGIIFDESNGHVTLPSFAATAPDSQDYFEPDDDDDEDLLG